MDYGFFYDIANYGNENWKGNFSHKEIAQNAYDYLYEYEESKANGKVTHTISELLTLLDEDNNEQAKEFANRIRESLGLNQTV